MSLGIDNHTRPDAVGIGLPPIGIVVGDTAVGQGPAGCYHEAALRQRFGDEVVYRDGGDFGDVLARVAGGEARFGAMAVGLSALPEDPITHANRKMIGLAVDAGKVIDLGNEPVRIQLGLVGLKGTAGHINTILAQPVAEVQCRGRLADLLPDGYVLDDQPDGLIAVRKMLEAGRSDTAAIVRPDVIEDYPDELVVIEEALVVSSTAFRLFEQARAF